ncbi:MAG: DUF374 domain-containing protein [Myxococcales bacterium]|nr:DUF374 domain-containing protein [Myxococcales bacterium]
MRARLLGLLIGLLVRAWTRTLRARRLGPAFDQPGLVAFWHGDQLPLVAVRPRGDVVAPISLSRDGRLQARVMAHLGVGDVPGSSSRGGLGAARGLARALRRGALALMAVDGPRGPGREVKAGVIWLAARVGCPVWPVGVAVRRGRRLRRAWDRFLLPCPFTRVVVIVGAPLHFAADEAPEAAQGRLAAAIGAATDAAREALA